MLLSKGVNVDNRNNESRWNNTDGWDDGRTLGPSRGIWVNTFDPGTGKAERVRLDLPILLLPNILRAARADETCRIKGRSKTCFYTLVLMGFPPLIVTSKTLDAIGIHDYRSARAIPACAPVRLSQLPREPVASRRGRAQYN